MRSLEKLITIRRAELLEIVRKNMEEHRRTFERALEGYRAAAIAKLEESLADAKAGKRVRQSIELIEPMDQTREYRRAVRMLELEVNDTVQVTEQEFTQYVMDEWHWKTQFINSTQSYVGASANG